MNTIDTATSAAQRPHTATPVATAPAAGSPFTGSDGFTFGDILDALNPLQHIPIVSNIYRHITGDEMAPVARIAGGGIFGGVIGLLASVVDRVVESVSGQDVADHVMVALGLGAEEQRVNTAAGSEDNPFMVAQSAAQIPDSPASLPTALPESLIRHVHELIAQAEQNQNMPDFHATPVVYVAPKDVPHAMMQALDQYQEMMRSRNVPTHDQRI